MAYHHEEKAVDYYVFDPNKRLVGLKLPQVLRLKTGEQVAIGSRTWWSNHILAMDPKEDLVVDTTGRSHSLRGMVTVNAADLQTYLKNWRPWQPSLFAPQEVQGAA